MPKRQKPDGTVAGSAKRLASRFYQLKIDHCLTGEYLHWSKSHPTPRCWWCQCPKQTRDHLLKRCPRWKEEQKVLGPKVEEEIGRGREQWKAHELFAEGWQCSQAILEFLASMDIGKTVPPVANDGDRGSKVSEGEQQEQAELEDKKRTEELGAENETGAGEGTLLFLPNPSFMVSVDS